MCTILKDFRLNMRVSLDVKGSPFSDYDSCIEALFIFMLLGFLGEVCIAVPKNFAYCKKYIWQKYE